MDFWQGGVVNTGQEPRDKNRDDLQKSLEQYLCMNEKEKDAEIQKAIGRLQQRIQEILYLLGPDTEKSVAAHPPHREEDDRGRD